MDGGDVFTIYLAFGILILFCFLYACCTNMKEDCGGKRSPSNDIYIPCGTDVNDNNKGGKCNDSGGGEDADNGSHNV